MAGHSHWKQIKQQKGTADKKRAALFSKLLAAISVAARSDPNPQFNPRLKTTIETAHANQVPNDNIERAIARASQADGLEELLIEAYGPEGVALLIEAITPSRNRTVSELRHLLEEHEARMAEPGSVRWAFERSPDGWRPKFPHPASPGGKEKLAALISELDGRDDIQRVITNG